MSISCEVLQAGRQARSLSLRTGPSWSSRSTGRAEMVGPSNSAGQPLLKSRIDSFHRQLCSCSAQNQVQISRHCSHPRQLSQQDKVDLSLCFRPHDNRRAPGLSARPASGLQRASLLSRRRSRKPRSPQDQFSTLLRRGWEMMTL